MDERINQWLLKRSGRLFARPSFLEGMARVLDLGAALNIYNYDKDGNEADAKALFSDWMAVGDVIRDSMIQFAQTNDLDSENQILATA